MRYSFQKVKTEHHILKEFQAFLLGIEKNADIQRIIPGRINRQQKGSSEMYFRISSDTSSGFKCIMCKGSTAQELFIICNVEQRDSIKSFISEAYNAISNK